MKTNSSLITLLALSSTSLSSFADNTSHAGYDFEEVVVSAPFRDREAETTLPIRVLTKEALQEKAANSLGETLKNEIGVNSASFGPGVGQPVIRGQSGRRVMALFNGVGVTDVAAYSPDHANAVEAILAERIEVIRGPSTLLYGSGAIGGVVNVVDNRVPERLFEKPELAVQQSFNSVSDEYQTVFGINASAGDLSFHFDAFHRENEDVEIKGFAIDEAAIEALEEHVSEHLEEGHHEEEEHEEEEHEEEHHDEDGHEEIENTNGFIGNSDAESHGFTLGLSWVGDSGFIGIAANELNNDYGLPPGTHSHGHHEEEHEDEHEEEGHGEEAEFVRIEMESRRYDLRGGLNFVDSWIQSVRGSVGYTDYQHTEIEIFEDGDTHVGTLYSNEGWEGRFTAAHAAIGNWTGEWGVQLTDTVFFASGEEAFIPKSDVSSLALFGVERYQQGSFTAEFGFRVEDNEVDPNGGCKYDGSSGSVSASLRYDLNERSNVVVGVSRSERAPGVEELFSNISSATCAPPADDEELLAHAATNTLDIGNPDLEEETANNLELGYRLHSGPISGQLSVFLNRIDDYIFLNLTGEEHEGVQLAQYQARDAEFKGVEAEVTFQLMSSDRGALVFGLFGDMVDAEFDDAEGGNVPRIPAAKLGAELHYFSDAWTAHLHVTEVDDQDDAGELELATDGYTNLSMYADYHFSLAGSGELKLFVRGDNLLDEEIRTHTSFLKNYAPEPGRSFTVGMRFEY